MVSALSLSLNITLLIFAFSSSGYADSTWNCSNGPHAGMAIDSNVLINERIREEIRNGSAPSTAISNGYEKAWATILDSNVTTLIAGLALLCFDSSHKRLCCSSRPRILTSMFSSVLFSQGIS